MLVRKHDAADPASMCALRELAPEAAQQGIAFDPLRAGVHRRRIYALGTTCEVLRSMNNGSSVSSVSSSSLSSGSSTSSKKITLGRTRGAAMVEYALLLCAVLLLAGGAYKTLGKKVNKSVKHSSQIL